MSISPAAALRDVEIATRSRRLADADSQAALTFQMQTILAALNAGAEVRDIANICGLSTARIYQIAGAEKKW